MFERARPAALAVDLRHGHGVHAFRRLLVALMQLGPELSRPFADGIGGEQLEPVVLLHPQLELRLGLEDADHHRVAGAQPFCGQAGVTVGCDGRCRQWRLRGLLAGLPGLTLVCSGCVDPCVLEGIAGGLGDRPVAVAEAVAGRRAGTAPRRGQDRPSDHHPRNTHAHPCAAQRGLHVVPFNSPTNPAGLPPGPCLAIETSQCSDAVHHPFGLVKSIQTIVDFVAAVAAGRAAAKL